VLQALPLVFVLAGLTLYTVLGGADLGAGFWQLAAGSGTGGEEVREHAHRAMGPVWEANHVWLVFVLTVFWTAYPRAFSSIASTLAVPLFIALIGIVFRGAAYALRSGAATLRESAWIDTVFSISSILVPFSLGAALGGIATDRVPVGNAAGDLWTSWLNATSVFIGVLAVATSAYIAAVYLAADAAHDGEVALEGGFRRRALLAGSAAGALAIAGIFVTAADNHHLFHSLSSGRALPAAIASGVFGIATLVLVKRRHYEPARYGAALAVAAIIVGWTLSRWPELLPGLRLHQAAAGHDTLVCLVVAVLGGGAIVFPALALLFRLALVGQFRAAVVEVPQARKAKSTGERSKLPTRVAGTCLIAGVGLLNVADAGWAHAIGVVCLIAFVAVGFIAIGVPTDGPDEAP
jgi:cytochrome bd ubiquinol oxidase subunit II